jgi:hypothetical protein
VAANREAMDETVLVVDDEPNVLEVLQFWAERQILRFIHDHRHSKGAGALAD